MKQKILLTLACVSSFAHGAVAHPGHGQSGSGGLLHYLVEWEHRWSFLAAAVIVATVWGYNRLTTSRRPGRR